MHRVSGCRVLAVSWHGPKNPEDGNVGFAIEEHRRKDIKSDLLKYLLILRRTLDPEHHKQIHIIIGGDFNVRFEEDINNNQCRPYGLAEEELSVRRNRKQEEWGNIDYFIASQSDKIHVTGLQNIFNSVNGVCIEAKIASLDHDPVIASVELKPYGKVLAKKMHITRMML